MDYLRYYLGALMQLTGIAGILAGGGWAWLGVAELPLFAILDPLLGEDVRERKRLNDLAMDVPVVLCSVLGPVVLAVLAWKVGQGGLSALELAGMIASCAWLGVVPSVPALHELYHKRSPWKYALGTYAQVPYMDCTRSVAHMMGHHLYVGMPKDADTPIRGESMYRFLFRTIRGNYAELYAMESAAARKWGRSVWSWQGRFTKAIAAYLAFIVVMIAVGGWAGAAAVFTATLVSRLWVEAFNYLQHCGLIRAEGEPVGAQHVWNHLSTITRIAAFEITNHCEHHQDAYVPYYRMRPDTDGPRMPSGFFCFLLATVPPLWNRLVLWPRLRDWDLHHATPAERELAREANRRAGWPDWLDSAAPTPQTGAASALV
jgi:p-cymene methyl-monooxygenase